MENSASTDSKILIAFEQYGMPGSYNVWRYDTPSTHCVLFGCKAESEQAAIEKAKELISHSK